MKRWCNPIDFFGNKCHFLRKRCHALRSSHFLCGSNKQLYTCMHNEMKLLGFMRVWRVSGCKGFLLMWKLQIKYYKNTRNTIFLFHFPQFFGQGISQGLVTDIDTLIPIFDSTNMSNSPSRFKVLLTCYEGGIAYLMI